MVRHLQFQLSPCCPFSEWRFQKLPDSGHFFSHEGIFVNGAPEQVVANERKKQADAEAKIKAIETQLAQLK